MHPSHESSEDRLSDKTPQANAIGQTLLSQIEHAGDIRLLANMAREYITIPDDQPTSAVLTAIQHLRDAMANDEQYLDTLYRLMHRTRENLLSTMTAFQAHLSDLPEGRIEDAANYRLQHLLFDAIDAVEDVPFRELEKLANEMHGLPTMEERLLVADVCEKTLHRLLLEREIFFEEDSYSRDPTVQRVTTENVDQLYYRSSITEKTRMGEKGQNAIIPVLQAIRSVRREHEIHSALGTIDREELAQNTRKFGAKGANLITLQKIIPIIDEHLSITVDLPSFQLLPTTLYKRWKLQEDISGDLRVIYDVFEGKALHVRSSAVHSEDGEDVTGAGIYDSISLPEHASFVDFCAAVEQVYRSTDSEKAIAYRRQNCIDEEELMGMVVQETVTDDYSREYNKGYANTSRPFSPGLSEVVYEDIEAHIIMRQDAIGQSIYQQRGRNLSDVAYYQFDWMRHGIEKAGQGMDLGQIGFLLQSHYRHPVQMEFVNNEKGIHLVQTRLLPKNMLKTVDISFPDQEPLYESDAIGIGDMELDVLPTHECNNEERGAVIFFRSYFATGRGDNIEKHLPKEGAVIIIAPSRENAGHIETLCAEKGLVCIFRSVEGPIRDEQPNPIIEELLQRVRDDFELTSFYSFGGHKRLRIVANGLKARIYPPTIQ